MIIIYYFYTLYRNFYKSNDDDRCIKFYKERLIVFYSVDYFKDSYYGC